MLAPLFLSFRSIRSVERTEPEARTQLRALISERPGLPLGALRDHLGIAWGTLYYHLARLEKAGEVKTVVEGRRNLAFPRGSALDPRLAAASSLLRGATVHQVAQAFRDHPTEDIRAIATRLGMPARVVYYHTKRLVDAGVFQSSSAFRYHNLRPTPLYFLALRSLQAPSKEEVSDERAHDPERA